MRSTSIFAASASFLALVQARIGGIGVPSTIKPGDNFNLIIEGTGYIQSVTDVSIAVGYAQGSAPLGDGLGTFITAFDLGKSSIEAMSSRYHSGFISSKLIQRLPVLSRGFEQRWQLQQVRNSSSNSPDRSCHLYCQPRKPLWCSVRAGTLPFQCIFCYWG